MRDKGIKSEFSKVERSPIPFRRTLSALGIIIPLIVVLSACKARSYPPVHRFIDHYSITKKPLKYEERRYAVKSFEFSTDHDSEGWKPVNGIGRFVVRGGKLHIKTIHNDPYMVANVNFTAEQVTAISITMKVPGGGACQVYWSNKGQGAFSGKLSHRSVLIPDNNFHTYYIFTEDLANWNGIIRRIRLDPIEKEAEIEIDAIKLLNIPIAERYQIEPEERRWRILYKGAINNESRNIILALPPSKIEQEVYIPRRAVFDFGYSILRNVWGSPGDGVHFSVKLTDPKGKTNTIFSHYIDPKHYTQHRRWFDARIDLSPWGGKKVKLTLQTDGTYPIESPFSRKPDLRYDYAVWSNPTVYGPEAEGEEPNVILIMLDTLRADTLGCYGYRRPTSPNIDRLAADPNSILFTRAFSSSPWTLPSHANMFTSKYLGMNSDYDLGRLFRKELTLAEVLRDAGYNTVAITGGAYVSYKLGFDQGFDLYWETPELELGKIEEIYQKTIEWLERKRTHKFFLFFHTYETHTPYIRDTFAKELPRGRIPRKFATRFAIGDLRITNIVSTATPQEKDYVRALYDGGVMEADKYLGFLFDKLKEKGLWDNTIIIITSDHGEEFWEHFNLGSTHGYSLYNELLHVPLIIYAPHLPIKKKSLITNVSLIDIFPTILELIGIKDFDEQKIMGSSLLPLISGEDRVKTNIIFSEFKSKGEKIRLQSIITDKYKYIYSLDGEVTTAFGGVPISINEEELFHLSYDPLERHNLISLESELTELARALLINFIELNKILLSKTTPKEELKIDEELRKKS